MASPQQHELKLRGGLVGATINDRCHILNEQILCRTGDLCTQTDQLTEGERQFDDIAPSRPVATGSSLATATSSPGDVPEHELQLGIS